MTSRFLGLLTIVAALAPGQTGLFRPATVHLKAGDPASEISSPKILHTGGASSWTSANLTGQLTVLTFFPDTSHNLESVSRWNALLKEFADKPVQFVWITEEEESTVTPWLAEHPIKGWVFCDPDGAIARSYGLELPFPAAVIIGKDGRIIGFDSSVLPIASTVDAALEGRITTTSPEPGLAAAKAFAESRMVLLDPEPPRMPLPQDSKKPNFTPSYTVHISPAQGSDQNNSGGDDFKSFQGFALKNVIAEL